MDEKCPASDKALRAKIGYRAHMIKIARLFILLPVLALSGCLFGHGERSATSASGPYPRTIVRPTSQSLQACYADLSRAGYRFSPLPDRDYGNGCNIEGAVQLIDIGLPVRGLKAMRCGLADKFAAWVTNGVRPAAIQLLGSDVVRMTSYGTYACRNVIGTASAASRRSGHAIANAVDIAALTLADGRRITVKDGWNSPDPRVREFLQVIHRSACRRFGTVLSPDYNPAHHDHLHLEDDDAGFCR